MNNYKGHMGPARRGYWEPSPINHGDPRKHRRRQATREHWRPAPINKLLVRTSQKTKRRGTQKEFLRLALYRLVLGSNFELKF